MIQYYTWLGIMFPPFLLCFCVFVCVSSTRCHLFASHSTRNILVFGVGFSLFFTLVDSDLSPKISESNEKKIINFPTVVSIPFQRHAKLNCPDPSERKRRRDAHGAGASLTTVIFTNCYTNNDIIVSRWSISLVIINNHHQQRKSYSEFEFKGFR